MPELGEVLAILVLLVLGAVLGRRVLNKPAPKQPPINIRASDFKDFTHEELSDYIANGRVPDRFRSRQP